MTARTMSEVYLKTMQVLVQHTPKAVPQIWESNILSEESVEKSLKKCREANPAAHEIVAIEVVWNVLNRA